MIVGICIGAAVLILAAIIYTYYFKLAFARKKPKAGKFSFAGSDDDEHKRKIKEALWGLFFIAPVTLGLIVFYFYPFFKVFSFIKHK